MKTIFFVMVPSCVAWAQPGVRPAPQPKMQHFDTLLTCGNRLRNFEVFKNESGHDGPAWQGRVGSSGYVDDGKYFGVKLSIRREEDQCFVELTSAERTLKFEYWVGSDLSKIKALTDNRSTLNETDRTCSVDYEYKVSLSNCSYPVKIIEERSPPFNRYNCEITSYSTFPAIQIDFIAVGSDKVCVGRTHCVARPILDDDQLTPPPYDSYVACLPASNGECLQSYKNCGDDKHAYPRDNDANDRMRKTLNLPARRGSR